MQQWNRLLNSKPVVRYVNGSHFRPNSSHCANGNRCHWNELLLFGGAGRQDCWQNAFDIWLNQHSKPSVHNSNWIRLPNHGDRLGRWIKLWIFGDILQETDEGWFKQLWHWLTSDSIKRCLHCKIMQGSEFEFAEQPPQWLWDGPMPKLLPQLRAGRHGQTKRQHIGMSCPMLLLYGQIKE